MTAQHDIQVMMQAVRRGRLSRREFMQRALALGCSASAAGGFLTACGTPAATAVPTVAPTATKAAAGASSAPSVAPATGGGATATAAPAGSVPSAAASSSTRAAATPTSGATPAGGTAPTTATRIGVTDTEIKLGCWGPQDGPAGAYGVISRTIDAYFKWVSNNGGIEGRKITFINENDSYQPAKTVAAVKKMVEDDKVFALVGGLGTANNLQVIDYLIQNNVPHLAPSTGSGLLANPVRPNVFAVQLNYSIEAALLARYAIETLGAKKVAIFFQNDAFGKEGLDAARGELKKKGLAATEVSYETTDKDFSAQALKLQASGADTVILYAVPAPGGGIIKAMTTGGFKPKLLASSVINDPTIFDLAGPGIDGLLVGAWLPSYDDLGDPKIVEFQNWMKANAPNEQAAAFAETGYTYAMIMTELLKRTGKDLTRERFIQTANGLQNYTASLVPNLSYAPTDHSGVKAMYFQQAKVADKKFVKITDFIELK